MIRRVSAPGLFLSLLLSLPLSAESGLWMEPLGPTNHTPIVFWYQASCDWLDSVTRQGAFITIFLTSAPCSPPRSLPVRIALPGETLPVGEYRVEVVVRGADGSLFPRPEKLRFVVRQDPRAELPFRVRPSVALAVGGVPLMIELGDYETQPDLCPNFQCKVLIGGVEAQKAPLPNSLDLRVIAPPHDAGLVDVTIIQDGEPPLTVRGALYYYDPGAYAMFSIFERILFPILADMPGAGGSLWRTETAIANPNPYWIETANYVQPTVCVTYPCAERIEPGAYTRFDGGTYPRGVALLAPRDEAPTMSFASRVRDISQDADSFGTELPVVREHDMARQRPAALLDVPLDPRYRVKVRVYAFDDTAEQQTSAGVVFYDPITKARRDSAVVLRRTCQQDACASTPYYGELDLQPAAVGTRTNIFITNLAANQEPLLKWAFASVTNNKTQQVTIVSASGNGGGSCLGCQP